MRIGIVLLLGITGFSSCIAADSPVQESLTLDAALLAVLMPLAGGAPSLIVKETF